MVNPWISKIIYQVEAIPVLPTGKLDLNDRRKLAEDKGAKV